MKFPPVEEQLAVIRRGVEKIVPEDELAQRLKQSRQSGTPLRIKYGIDPTGVDLHLGHTVPLRKMRQFQQLGHQAVIIIGNATALVGDPSGRDETRARLSAEQVEANSVDYLNQLRKIRDFDLDKAEVVRNGDWFTRMSFADLLELCSKVTVAQLLTRDDFSKRFKAETAIYLHECLYPIMQAWDSVKVRADVELGGTEQLYSFMLARDLQRNQNMPGQISVMSPILVGIDGVRRMGKSLSNYIGISEPPFEMMKEFMRLPDECMRMYFELLTDLELAAVDLMLLGHPKKAKMELAKEIISEYHDAASAEEAAKRWEQEIAKKTSLPADIPTVTFSRTLEGDSPLPAASLLKRAGLCVSHSEARRVITQGGAYVGEDKKRIESHDEPISLEDGLLLWVGKQKICRIELVDEP